VTDEIKQPPSALIGEAASLFYLIGGMAAKHLVIVGGLVPPLLVPEAADTHIGSADIDLCLSLAITKGATREYQATPLVTRWGSGGAGDRHHRDVADAVARRSRCRTTAISC